MQHAKHEYAGKRPGNGSIGAEQHQLATRRFSASVCGVAPSPPAAAAMVAAADAQWAAAPQQLPRLLARAAPAGLRDAPALTQWARGPLRSALRCLAAEALYDAHVAQVDAQQLCLAYRRRHPHTLEIQAALAPPPGPLDPAACSPLPP